MMRSSRDSGCKWSSSTVIIREPTAVAVGRSAMSSETAAKFFSIKAKPFSATTVRASILASRDFGFAMHGLYSVQRCLQIETGYGSRTYSRGCGGGLWLEARLRICRTCCEGSGYGFATDMIVELLSSAVHGASEVTAVGASDRCRRPRRGEQARRGSVQESAVARASRGRGAQGYREAFGSLNFTAMKSIRSHRCRQYL